MPGTDENVMELIELTKVFRDFWGRERVKAVDHLNLEVRRGEVFGLLGPNGSGKTTTVRIVLGLLFPTQGAVRLFGRGPGNVDIKKRVGYMPEESHLYSYLNAEETLDFFARLFGLSRRERQRRTDALIDMVGLKRARRRPLGEFSKGMARRIGLAQALINDPDLLILDEPTTGLDPVGAREMKDLILTLRERGKTVFVCSHLLSDVEEICDRIGILYGGKSRALGTVKELLTAEDVTQIRAPKLDKQILDSVVKMIREAGGADSTVEVSSPTRRLEEFFLNVINEARRERLMTAGAEMGGGTAEFLGKPEAEGEALLEELVLAGQEAESEILDKPAQPTPALPRREDRAFIDDLVSKGAAEDGGIEESPGTGPQAAVTPDSDVRDRVLRELMDQADEDAQDDDEDSQ